ncbi:RNA cap guanine-N2 methyltransferase [Nitzschia inconspicua]|uniref:RNA cap guanine-N2 methyltransferase n=1 Tax=Nitzschia inconspicua TaxID=303405 RepID=A0A9K3M098_9STRA|nr:RNA cap guanine-N2 methyltransferase [Nitzschia inconspicua]
MSDEAAEDNNRNSKMEDHDGIVAGTDQTSPVISKSSLKNPTFSGPNSFVHQKKEAIKRKRKRNKRHNNNYNQKQSASKRPKKGGRFWIEDCADTALKADQNRMELSLELLITRSTLEDDYRQAPLLSDKGINPFGYHPTTSAASTCASQEKECLEDMAVAGQRIGAAVSTMFDKATENPETKTSIAESTHDGNDSFEDVSVDIHKNTIQPTVPSQELPKDHIEEEDMLDRAIILVKRGNSAKKPMQSGTATVENFQPLPHGDCGDGILNPYPQKEVDDKFWSQRRRLFTRFDCGIQLDPESWFSVTPEAIANHIAAHLVGTNNHQKKVVVLDPFCGCGGNSIAFARRNEVDLVVSVDTDLSKLEKAAANAAIYDISPEKMVFVHDNGCRVMSCYKDKKLSNDPSNGRKHATNFNSVVEVQGFKIGGTELLPLKVDCIFLSPPWGGVDYGKVGKRNYTLQCIQVQPMNSDEKSFEDGEDILRYAANCLGRNGPIAYFLPRNTNGISFGKSALKAGYVGPVVMEQNVLNGKLKTITAYLGL